MSDVDLTATADQPHDGQPPPEEGWLQDRRGRFYVRRPDGKGGGIYRRGDETIAQALERDAAEPRDKRPRSRSKSTKPKLPPPPAAVDLRELEKLLTEALKMPAMPCAMFGDQWAANHFTDTAAPVARNLVLASEHNPWLRRKLEGMVTGQDAAAKVMAMMGVTGALFAYAVPPIVWWFNLPVPDQARVMFGIPAPREKEPERAESPETAETAEPVAVAA